jgi:hypothetical protein
VTDQAADALHPSITSAMSGFDDAVVETAFKTLKAKLI